MITCAQNVLCACFRTAAHLHAVSSMADGEKRRVDKMSNVLVFAPPKICFHQPYKKLRIENQGMDYLIVVYF